MIDRLMLQMGIFKPKTCYCLFNLCLVFQNLSLVPVNKKQIKKKQKQNKL